MSILGRSGRDHHEAEHAHQSLDGVGRQAPAITLPPILFHNAGRAASLPESPVHDHAPAARGLLAGLKELGQISEGSVDDHEVVGQRAKPGSGS